METGNDYQLEKPLIVKIKSPRQYHRKCKENSVEYMNANIRMKRVK